jgi:hypothetical protein
VYVMLLVCIICSLSSPHPISGCFIRRGFEKRVWATTGSRAVRLVVVPDDRNNYCMGSLNMRRGDTSI